MSETNVREALPEIDEIDDASLREQVVDAYELAMAENGVEDLTDVPWRPPEQERLGLGDQWLVDHLREVAAGALMLAELFNDTRDAGINTDTVVAGGLIHDVSKLYEFAGWETTEIGSLLGHPYYGVYVAGCVGLSPELVAITINHTAVTNVEPASPEAWIVRAADYASAAALRGTGLDDLREV